MVSTQIENVIESIHHDYACCRVGERNVLGLHPSVFGEGLGIQPHSYGKMSFRRQQIGSERYYVAHYLAFLISHGCVCAISICFICGVFYRLATVVEVVIVTKSNLG